MQDNKFYQEVNNIYELSANAVEVTLPANTIHLMAKYILDTQAALEAIITAADNLNDIWDIRNIAEAALIVE